MRIGKSFRTVLWLGLVLSGLVSLSAQAQEDDNGEGPEEEGAAAQEVREPRVVMISHGPGRLEERLETRFPDQSVTLEADGEPFTALRKERTVAARQGGAVIIADVGGSPARGWPNGIRHALADAGWMSLSIGLPGAALKGVPERIFEPRQPLPEDVEEVPVEEEPAEVQEAGGDGNGDNGGQGNGDEAAAEDQAAAAMEREQAMTINVPDELDGDERDEWQERALARVAAAVDALREEGLQNIVLIGVGAGADIGLRYMQDNQAMFPPGGMGMVWIGPRLSPPYNEALDQSLGEGMAIPILDLYDRRSQGGPARDRLESARRGNFENYAQSGMPLRRHTSKASERRVGSRVRGWLENNMVGMEIE